MGRKGENGKESKGRNKTGQTPRENEAMKRVGKERTRTGNWKWKEM